jgi:hypothetical protein
VALISTWLDTMENVFALEISAVSCTLCGA